MLKHARAYCASSGLLRLVLVPKNEGGVIEDVQFMVREQAGLMWN
jgi:hypothetical protein